MRPRVLVSSLVRAGRLIPKRGRGLRASVVILPPGEVMEWHSTRGREELLVVLAGRVQVELQASPRRYIHRAVRVGQAAFVPRETRHRVLNCSRMPARYLYVTGSAV
jgi:mannose-6-phosphate isomerase-like protein (cupin superfamily)